MGATVIEARCTHNVANALQLVFLDRAEDEPMATALQNGAGGKGSKVATLFGFKTGGTGTHSLTYRDGSVLHVKSGNMVPTEVVRPDGVSVATIERGDDVSVARAAGGTDVVRFVAHPDGAKTIERFRLLIRDPDDAELGELDVIRTSAGWNVFNEVLWELTIWRDRAAPVKIPFLGTRVTVNRSLSETERDAIVAACVDIAIGLRPYVKEMR